jgi:hypothetical protein
MKADAVLVGSVDFATRKAGSPQEAGLSHDFAQVEAQVAVTVRVISVGSGRAIYEHVGRKKGPAGSAVLREAALDAAGPLAECLGRAKK